MNPLRILALLLAPAVGFSADLEPRDLEPFLDGVIGAQLRAHDIAGVTVSVVKDGQLLFAKGYGYADCDKRRPVLPDRTLFRVASISKTLLWTAVMQLVDEGKLDLHADVNRYLKDFQIPATFPQPITLERLMTHTPGFEDRLVNLFPPSPKALEPLGKYLAEHMPRRVRPPGEVIAYSNYGTALAGYIVQQISGLPYADYLEQRIFRPLRMTHSTVRQPLPPALAGDLATGYRNGNEDRWNSGGFEYMNLFPAGAVSTTAVDMANFLIAHLEDGKFGDFRLLSEASARRMHAPAFSYDPRVGGMALGFFDDRIGGRRVIWHGGDTMLFHSTLLMLPAKVGLFASYNTASGGRARGELNRVFLDRYFPVSPAAVPKPVARAAVSHRFDGYYVSMRREYSTLLSVGALLGSVGFGATVKSRPDGTVEMLNARWVEVEPGVFRSLSGGRTAVIRDGRLLPGPFAFEKAPWYLTPLWQFGLAGTCLALFLSALLGWPVAALTRWGKRRGPFRLWATWTAAVLAVLSCAYVAVFFSVSESLVEFLPPWFRLWLGLGLLIPVLACALAAFAILAWRRREWALPMRVHYTLVAGAAVVFALWLNAWNLLGFRY